MTTSRQRMAAGRHGERAAARHLVGLGMVVLDRNWRCELGEIDLVLRDGPAVVFCEVKTRAGDSHGSPLEAVTPVKLARLRRLGARWLDQAGLRADEARIDLVGVRLDRGGASRLEHVRGVG